MTLQIFRADRLIDGTGASPVNDVEVFVERGVITAIAPTGTRPRPVDAATYYHPGKTVTPGFIDTHVHLMFGSGNRTYEDVIDHDSDDLMLLRGARNAYLHLRAGVTTVRDCGARARIGYALREGWHAGLFLSPRIQVCGRPITITGGHFWWCGSEADGLDGVRRETRRMVKEQADFIKIMGSGGGTRGTDANRASYSVDELRVIVEEAHQAGKTTVIHCLAAESVVRAAEAGVDQIEHFNFTFPDGRREFDERAAEQIIAKGIVLGPTIQTGYRQIQRLEAKGDAMTDVERRRLDENRYKLETKLSYINRFHQLGAAIVAGTDAIQEFGDYAVGLELLHRAGLTNMEVIVAATSRAAKAVGWADRVGTLAPGFRADLVYLDGDPLEDIAACGQVAAVALNGALVVDKRLDLAVGLPALADGTLTLAPIRG